jgi:hypothetical protein
LNHIDTIEDYATLMDSPPRPKMTLPASIIQYFCLYAPSMHTNYPNVNMEVNKSNPGLIPILSRKTPPKIGKTIFGILYTVYSIKAPLVSTSNQSMIYYYMTPGIS